MTMETELLPVERYFYARDENGDLYLASSNYEMGSKDERGADWVLASDYDALLALHNASLSRERELQAKLEIVVADELKTIHAKLEAESQLRELREIVKGYRNQSHSMCRVRITYDGSGIDSRCSTCKAADLFLEKDEATK